MREIINSDAFTQLTISVWKRPITWYRTLNIFPKSLIKAENDWLWEKKYLGQNPLMNTLTLQFFIEPYHSKIFTPKAMLRRSGHLGRGIRHDVSWFWSNWNDVNNSWHEGRDVKMLWCRYSTVAGLLIHNSHSKRWTSQQKSMVNIFLQRPVYFPSR